MKTVQDILSEMSAYLEKRNIPSPKRASEELLGSALNLKRLDLYLNFERPLVEEELQICRDYLKRAGANEPLEYILGSVEFYGVKLRIDPRVLIPRPETELMVDQIAFELKDATGVLWDLCTGSGCIGLALKKALPQLEVICSDICPDALEVARQNAAQNGLEVTFYQGNFLDAVEGPVDYLVTNPPYVLAEEMTSVLEHEPHMALLGGLSFYEKLARGLDGKVLKKVWMEIGSTQGKAVADLFSAPPYSNVTCTRDLAGLDRVISLELQ